MSARPITTTSAWPPVCRSSVAVRSTDCLLLDCGAPAPIAYLSTPYPMTA